MPQTVRMLFILLMWVGIVVGLGAILRFGCEPPEVTQPPIGP